jgi:hypothetical protein
MLFHIHILWYISHPSFGWNDDVPRSSYGWEDGYQEAHDDRNLKLNAHMLNNLQIEQIFTTSFKTFYTKYEETKMFRNYAYPRCNPMKAPYFRVLFFYSFLSHMMQGSFSLSLSSGCWWWLPLILMVDGIKATIEQLQKFQHNRIRFLFGMWEYKKDYFDHSITSYIMTRQSI